MINFNHEYDQLVRMCNDHLAKAPPKDQQKFMDLRAALGHHFTDFNMEDMTEAALASIFQQARTLLDSTLNAEV